MPNFDAEKSLLELKIENVAKTLERTHPEQTADAMSDYAAALAIIENEKDIRVIPIVAKLKRLYLYPTRAEHNAMLIDLHDFKELLYETRIDKTLKARKAHKNLGESNKPSKLPLLLMLGVLAFILAK